MNVLDNIITASIEDFIQISSLGRTKVYELLGKGLLTSTKIGKRRLILLDSYRKLIEQQRVEAPTGRTVR
jgi:hypothetical protein